MEPYPGSFYNNLPGAYPGGQGVPKPPSRPPCQAVESAPPRSGAALRYDHNPSGSVVSSQIEGTVATQKLSDDVARHFDNPRLRQALEANPEAGAALNRFTAELMAKGDSSTVVSGQSRNSGE